MLDLVELTINEAILKFIVLKQNDQRIFTPRIDRKRFNKQLFDAIDNFYISRDLASQIHSIDDLIDYLYIAQYSYFIVSEEMRRAKPPSHWREDIERKISKLSQELEIIKQFIDNRNPTNKMLSERVKRVLRKHQVHTNNRQSLELASRRIESSILNYQSKIKFADRRRKMIKDNRKFECYRSRFYREIDEHIVAAKQHHLQDRLQKRLDQHQQQDEDGEESESEKGREEDVDAQKPSLSSKILSTELRKEIVEYWQDIWRYHEKEFSHQNLLQNLRSCSYHSQSSQSSLPSIDSSTVWSENRINLVIDSIMSNLEHWKAPGPDMV
ncbi:hypothetical protein QR98_0071290 [Sarcoptes scabiei]|uniref:Uncharacterized protein n=1 Tax=Sarcoptes scabiei TaxID=52283 RepID=A0A132ACH4_SARSC|nr:hypothetical protein QR98_0071290 [Sarcoptes scabiei]